MDTLQTWIVVGVPVLLVAGSLLVGRSNARAWMGYAVLLAGAVVFALVPGDPLSASALGLVVVGLVAVGRGQNDDRYAEHHEHRERFTTAEH